MRAHLRAELLARARQLSAQPLTVLTGPGGSGKSTLARAWQAELDRSGKRMAWLSVRTIHRDPILFVEDWVEAIQLVSPEPWEAGERIGENLLRSLPRSGKIGVEAIVRLIRAELKRLKMPLVICLGAFEHLNADGPSVGIVNELLRLEFRKVAWLITSRGLCPSTTSRMLAEGSAVKIPAAELSLRTDQIQQVLADAEVELDELAGLPPERMAATFEVGRAGAARLFERGMEPEPAVMGLPLEDGET